MAEELVEQVNRSSSEQAEANEHVARTPQAPAPESSAGQLIGHTTERDIVTDEDGNVVAEHQTTVITDPESELAVQVLEGPTGGRNAAAEPTALEAIAAAEDGDDSAANLVVPQPADVADDEDDEAADE